MDERPLDLDKRDYTFCPVKSVLNESSMSACKLNAIRRWRKVPVTLLALTIGLIAGTVR